jgi:mono/diheme cytochrome c family protein
MVLALCLSLCVACSALPQAAKGPDPLITRGNQFALVVCSDCHVVAPDQPFSPTLKVSAPPFLEVANRPTTSERSLQRFIRSTHWDGQTIPMTMPAPQMTSQEIVAVSHYIMSLRKAQ